MFFKRIEVDEEAVTRILYNFMVGNCLPHNIVITYEVLRSGDVVIRSTHPGILIGKYGSEIDFIKRDMRLHANVKNVRICQLRKCLTYDTGNNVSLH